MIKGIGASRAGMAWEQARTDVISNNVANINTDGYRRSVAVGREFGSILLRRMGDRLEEGSKEPVVGQLGQGAALAEVVVDQKGGALRFTDQPLDVALMGPGEFTFAGPTGLGYTRIGSFQQDATGQLVTAEGYPVLVNGSPVGAGSKSLKIRDDAGVEVDGKFVGRLDIRGGATTRLEVGVLEGSNVDLAQEMTDLITSLRSYQLNQRALQIQDQTLSKAVSELANL